MDMSTRSENYEHEHFSDSRKVKSKNHWSQMKQNSFTELWAIQSLKFRVNMSPRPRQTPKPDLFTDPLWSPYRSRRWLPWESLKKCSCRLSAGQPRHAAFLLRFWWQPRWWICQTNVILLVLYWGYIEMFWFGVCGGLGGHFDFNSRKNT